MDKKEVFGSGLANELKVGDIVEWSKWNPMDRDWQPSYGVVMEIKNEIKGNRMVSVSIVVPLTGPKAEMEFFTPTLRLVSKARPLRD
jgi:hypothetical protein